MSVLTSIGAHLLLQSFQLTNQAYPSNFSPANPQRPSASRPHRSSSSLQVAASATTAQASQKQKQDQAPTDIEYDAIIIGSGMGGLTTAAKLVEKGQKVLVLEKYIIPGGSAAHFERQGFTFDVGSSMMFGFGDKGTTNLMTRALASVGKRLETAPDPTQIHYHLPNNLEVKVWRDYEEFVKELVSKFPHEEKGIKTFYNECWRVFNSLNSLELKSLEEPRYLLEQFANNPGACLTLASFVATNAGDVARKHIKDPDLLHFIDIECYCWSTVNADLTPMINAGMVFCDRHFGGINYPIGGVGKIPELMAEGIIEGGGLVEYKANVKEIVLQGGDTTTSDGTTTGPPRAVGVRLADGRVYKGKAVVSNATRWDTFGHLIPDTRLPPSEAAFRGRYVKAPSFLSIHAGIKADVLPPGTECHHIIVENWQEMEDPYGTLFVSIPSLLDPTICPEGTHVFHTFSPDWIDAWEGLGPGEYEAKKQQVADAMFKRLERFFPGLIEGTIMREVGTPRTHRKFLNRSDGSYGPIPSRRPLGMLSMPFNTTAIDGLYCVGDSTFPGQGVNAVVFSGFGCAHRMLVDQGKAPRLPVIDEAFNALLRTVRDNA